MDRIYHMIFFYRLNIGIKHLKILIIIQIIQTQIILQNNQIFIKD
jgi:hypothetical protein